MLRGREGRALDVENVGGEGGIAPPIPRVGPLARGPAPEAVGASAGLAQTNFTSDVKCGGKGVKVSLLLKVLG